MSQSCNTIDHNNNTIYLDIAVLCKEYSNIDVTPNNNHIVELDEIPISETMFRKIFYPYGENFGLDKNKYTQDMFHFITFLPSHRTVDKKAFSLLEQIILFTEIDLNVTRNCFTKCTLIELSNEITNIKTLNDLNCCNTVACMSWSNIVSILKHNYINKDNSHPYRNALLVISVVFKSLNVNVLPIIVKFKYRVQINTSFIYDK